MSQLNFKLAVVLSLFVAAVVASTAMAQGEDDEAQPAKKANRNYAGGQDEQALTVQPTLVVPGRTLDTPRATPIGSGAAAQD